MSETPGTDYLALPDDALLGAQATVVELIAGLDRAAAAAWPSARTPPAAFIVGLCAWCAVTIETGDGRTWRHTGPIPPAPCTHTAEPTRTTPPTFPPPVRTRYRP